MKRRIFLFHTLTLVAALVILLAVSGGVVRWVMDAYQRQDTPSADQNMEQARQAIDEWDTGNWNWEGLDRMLREADYRLVVQLGPQVVYSSLDQYQQELYLHTADGAVWPAEGSLMVQVQGTVMIGRRSGDFTLVAMKERLFETIWGYDYELGTSSAIYKCSSQGEFSAGDLVTLLLGMNGEVVDVIAVSEIQSTYYGVVVSSQKVSSSSSSASSASVQIETQVACTDGSLRTFYTDGTSTYSTGRLVQASVDGDGTSIKTLQTRSLSGTVSSDGTSFAGYDFADNVEILDTDENGGYARIYPSRLAGERLSADDVSYYSLNASGDIERLILSEATGDTLDYVYITSAENQSSGMSVSGAYTYYQDGELHTISTSAVYSVDTGGAALIYEDGELQSMRQLTAVTLTDLGSLTAEAGDQSYDLAEDVVVILRGTGGNGWYESSLSEINDQDYTLRGWYDNLGFSAGRRIRIIVATPE